MTGEQGINPERDVSQNNEGIKALVKSLQHGADTISGSSFQHGQPADSSIFGGSTEGGQLGSSHRLARETLQTLLQATTKSLEDAAASSERTLTLTDEVDVYAADSLKAATAGLDYVPVVVRTGATRPNEAI